MVQGWTHWSLRYKLLAILLLLGITTFAVTGAISYVKQFHSLKENVTNQLTSVRRSKAFQLESYYRTIHNHVLTLSDDRMFIDAMREFRGAYNSLNAKPVPEEVRQAVFEDYRRRVYPDLERLAIARPRVEDYMPVTPAAMHLQYDYIVKNPFPFRRRREMLSSEDDPDYSRVHAKYHPAFRKIVETYGYYDLYLIDYDTESAVYDVNKDRDFGTSLRVGPYRDSAVSKVVARCLRTDDRDDVFFSDFEPYEAARGEPTQWVTSPIFDGSERLGVLALQISPDYIDDVATGQRGWKRDGLGQTGRSDIVGPDYLLRSNPRPFLETPDLFFQELKDKGTSEAIIHRIQAYNSAILLLETKYPSVTAALAGQEGTTIEGSAFGPGQSLVSFMPLHIEGLHWVLESRIDLNEAFKPIIQMQRFFIWWGAVLFLLTVAAALLLTRQLLRPINALATAARKVAAGDLSAKANWKSDDELGELCDTFNSMTKSIGEKTKLIKEKNRENERLLLNILPGEIAKRLKEGENEIADNFADVTVLFGDIVGFTALSSRTAAPQIVEMLNGLFTRFDEVASELKIEKIKTIGDCYMAVCGLPHRSSDHAERTARMALRMADVTRDYGKEQGLNLELRIGLNSGPVVAGVIGTTKFIYDLWGDTVNLASRMESTGVPGKIQVTRSVYERLKDGFEFEGRGLVSVKGKGEIEAWLLLGELRRVAAAG